MLPLSADVAAGALTEQGFNRSGSHALRRNSMVLAQRTGSRSKGMVPERAVHGCEAGGGEKAREDAYLIDKEAKDIGIKKREGGGTEVKVLVSVQPLKEPGLPTIPDFEFWTKVNSKALTLSGLPLVTLKKVRWIRKVDTNAVHPVEMALGADERPKAGEELPKQGCNVEFTEVTVIGGETAYTFGFEAFGTLQHLQRNLVSAATLIFSASHRRSLEGSKPVIPNGYPRACDRAMD